MHRSLFSGAVGATSRCPGGREHPRRRRRALAQRCHCCSRDDPMLFHLGGGGARDAARRVGADRPAGGAPSRPVALARRRCCCWSPPPSGAPTLPARRARAPRSGSRSTGGAIVAVTSDRPRRRPLHASTRSHGDAVVGTIWDSFLGDLRLWGLVVGAGGADRRRAVRAGSARRLAAAARPGAHAARRRRRVWPAPAHCSSSPCCSLWMPEVPLDLALITLAGGLVFVGRRRGRARLLRSVIIAPSRRCGRLPEIWRPSAGFKAPQSQTNARSPGGSSAGCSWSARSLTTLLPLLPGAEGKVLTPTFPLGDHRLGVGPARRAAPGLAAHAGVGLPRVSRARGHGVHRRPRCSTPAGSNSPARFLLLLSIVFTAYFFPAREAWPYFALALLVHALPFAYDAEALDAALLGELLILGAVLLAADVPADQRQARDDRAARRGRRARPPRPADRDREPARAAGGDRARRTGRSGCSCSTSTTSRRINTLLRASRR